MHAGVEPAKREHAPVGLSREALAREDTVQALLEKRLHRWARQWRQPLVALTLPSEKPLSSKADGKVYHVGVPVRWASGGVAAVLVHLAAFLSSVPVFRRGESSRAPLPSESEASCVFGLRVTKVPKQKRARLGAGATSSE